MLKFHFPSFDHLAKFSDAVVNKLFFVDIRIADDAPKELSHIRLKLRVPRKLPQLAQALKFL